MRASLLKFIDANWYGRSRWTWLLLPLAWLFGAIVCIRRWAYQRGYFAVADLPVPVIVVGNITVGGTGKSPTVAWLAQQLLARGKRPGIISRGYGGRADALPVLVDEHVDPALVGDEPVMLAKQTRCPVSVCRDRVAAGRQLTGQGVDVVIADDGLQHYRLHRDMEIIVVDADRQLGNGCLLPAGPLREPASRLNSADCVLLNGSGGAIEGTHFFLQADKLRALSGDEQRDLNTFTGRRVWMVAGIGNPERFARLLRSADINPDVVPVPDHGRVSLSHLRRRQPQPILMTEKDAVKYRDNSVEDCWYLPVSAVFDDVDQREVMEKVNRVLARTSPD